MGLINEAVGVGVEIEHAKWIVGSKDLAVSAAGTGQSDATTLTAAATLLTTVASSTGVKPHADIPVDSVMRVYNGGANPVLIYPPSGGQLNNKTVNTGTVSVASGKGATLTRLSDVHWGVVSD